MIRESEKVARKEKQRMLKERWKLIRWLANFIDENTDKWNMEGFEKDEEEKWNEMEINDDSDVNNWYKTWK